MRHDGRAPTDGRATAVIVLGTALATGLLKPRGAG
jgi:hypothetical protein